MVRLVDVFKSYREAGEEHRILDGVRLTLAAGEFAVLLGRSGSGKSTILNLIAGIDRPDAGEIHVGAQRIDALAERERTLFRRHHIGFVFQAFNLVPTLTALENLLLPLELAGRLRHQDTARARSVLDDIGLAGRHAAFPDRLSGGEQQRVAIARAVVHEPDLLLADEPTGNLDLETGAEVLALLDRVVRGRGGTTLMATHSRVIAAHADRVLQIRDGHLEEVDVDGGGA